MPKNSASIISDAELKDGIAVAAATPELAVAELRVRPAGRTSTIVILFGSAAARLPAVPKSQTGVESRYPDRVSYMRLPRWIEIPLGILLGGISLLCGLAGVFIGTSRADRNPVLIFVIGAGIVLLSGWTLAKSARLVTGRPTRGGLLSPFGLRMTAAVFLLLPIVGLFTGHDREHLARSVYQTVIYLLIAAGLWRLARSRDGE